MINVIQFLNYCVRIVVQPVSTATRIVQDRNSKANYYAVWLALVAIIVNMVLSSQETVTRIEKQGASHTVAVTADWVGIFIMAPLIFFIGRILFVSMTKGGIRLLNRKRYPIQEQERIDASNLLQLVYPYLYVPIATNVFLQLLFYPLSSAVITLLLLFTVLYVIMLQVVFIKRIYGVSGIVAFFSPVIVWWLILLIFWIIWLITTGSVFVLSNYT